MGNLYTIVKYAGKIYRPNYFKDDPTEGVHISHSCYDSYVGRRLNIQETYESKELANMDCEKLNKENPSGDYAVCPVVKTA